MSEPGLSDPSRDAQFMDYALRLGRRGLGRTAPNPSVGCVIVAADGRILGSAHTAPGGRPHAETRAISDAAGRYGLAALRGATAYVTLEPCSHSGVTGPCAGALVAAGIARTVVALQDPDPRVAGRGLAMLEAGGVAVTLGVGAAAATCDHEGFLTRIRTGRPFVTLKLAASLDGRIATSAGESQWITGPAARAAGHSLRASHDAILVGSGTVLADDPQLTCRLPGRLQDSPVRTVLDSRLALGDNAALLRSLDIAPLWLIAGCDADPARVAQLEGLGATVMVLPQPRPEIGAVLALLGQRGICRLLVEGGPRVAASLLRADAVDAIVLFQAPMALGGDARPAIEALALATLMAAPRFVETDSRQLGADRCIRYRRRRESETGA